MSARASFRAGVRMGLPFAAVGAVLSLSFAVLARQAGFTPLQAILTSVVVFAGPPSSPRSPCSPEAARPGRPSPPAR
jgi:predicted branched-subunit amino acid permease